MQINKTLISFFYLSSIIFPDVIELNKNESLKKISTDHVNILKLFTLIGFL